MKFTTEGKRHLGAAIRSSEKKVYATEKVNNWCEKIIKLSEYAKTQPHAAYSALRHGKVLKFAYFLRTIPGMQECIKPLDHLIIDKFIPT